MTRKQKLELTWVGKDDRPRLEPRILLEDPSKSCHAARRVTTNDQFDNRLIFGDNLLALKALEQEFAGKVKCVFIDPPYNTGSAFEHYDDGVEHSLWLSMMRDRLSMLHRLMHLEATIWITLDDTEHAYCRVLCDEIFGRDNFLANVIWEKSDSPRMDAEYFSSRHDNVLVFARDKASAKLGRLELQEDGTPAHYDQRDLGAHDQWEAVAVSPRTRRRHHRQRHSRGVDRAVRLGLPVSQVTRSAFLWCHEHAPKVPREPSGERDDDQRQEKCHGSESSASPSGRAPRNMTRSMR